MDFRHSCYHAGLASSHPACSSIIRDQTSDRDAEFVGTPTNFEDSLGSTSTVSDEGRSVHQLGEFSRQDTTVGRVLIARFF